MFNNTVFKFWSDYDELAVAPYAEKANRKINWFDRTLLEFSGRATTLLSVESMRSSRFVRQVDGWERSFENLADFNVRQHANQLRPRLLKEGFTPALVAESFGLIREVTRRRLGLWHHPVQLQGGLAMLNGSLVEMATGEGKTITALLPAVTVALAGLPVHVITVNDYLAERDEQKLRPVFESLGLSSGMVQHDMSPQQRGQVYNTDIVYVTNKELTFDYLKDRVSLKGSRSAARLSARQHFTGNAMGRTAPMILRGLHFAIIDEADSILIDEARTPLIISADSDASGETVMFQTALMIADGFREERDFKINHKDRYVRLTTEGKRSLEIQTGDLPGLWRIRKAREELALQALSALHLFEKDTHYIVIDGKVQIVDEFTGRIMEDRSWEGGLHQMIEMKEGVELTARRETLARITYQRFFSRYLRLSGMSGTAREIAGELKSVFSLRTVCIPTNRPVQRSDYGIRLYAKTEQKWQAVVATIRQIAGKDLRPVLIGTTSVEASEHLSDILNSECIEHVVLNARQDKDEAQIIAQAGQKGAVTVATNMAGRGTDIVLGEGVSELGGLHVILTEFHESSRIDRQLFGRSGRQGDPGSCESIVSLQDALFLRYSPQLAKRVRHLTNSASGLLPTKFANMLRNQAQQKAEKENLETRRSQVEMDYKLDKSLAFSGRPE